MNEDQEFGDIRDIQDPRTFLFQLTSDMYGIENMAAEDWMEFLSQERESV